MVLTDINTLRPCKDITGLTVSVGAGIKETAETLRIDLLTFSNLYDVLNLFPVMILQEYSINLQMNFAKTIFPFSTRCNLSR